MQKNKLLHVDMHSGPYFRYEPLAAVAGGLPKAEESADFIVMQQAVSVPKQMRL